MVGGLNTTALLLIFPIGFAGMLTTDDVWERLMRLFWFLRTALHIFAGAIDDVRLWNRALSADEIKDFMNQGAEILTGGTAVEPQDKLGVTWAKIKSAR